MSKLNKKTALVTGASKGIGAGIALELAKAGASIVVNYASDKTGAEATVRSILAEGGEAIPIQGDVSNAVDVKRIFDQTANSFGAIDILVNNAGVYQAMAIEDVTEDEFHREMHINLLGPLLMIRESLKHFRPSGSIINIGSAISRMPAPMYSIYAASKSGLNAVTIALAKELGPRGIRVNSINPGATLSEGTKESGLYGVDSDFEKQLVSMTPLGRIGPPLDIARVVVFLASEESSWLTGELIHATGGL
ncbi:3-oxoacyl-[acyl-carrier-protein] reductase FabG [Pirellula sp. SH-Sr6A]|uniref:SDR family NAD(P)-dependent oxidoreductase n=1 Tax=Pirellula sp. SH-Sr6A TaxID=1632865 RepID=UPI00078E637D|nr:glucose 1-dehydrogenase [Pirellula sp. SH-Sr6A]AMV31519.1 3-oxoacyl-[acyl-carrier-protein] reductase FabG [Pirellula sp. SH-Sr6A]